MLTNSAGGETKEDPSRIIDHFREMKCNIAFNMLAGIFVYLQPQQNLI